MSRPLPVPGPSPRPTRALLSVLAALVGVAVVGGGGAVLPVQQPPDRPAAAALVGRTTSACGVSPAVPGSSTAVAAVVSRQAPARTGRLTVTTVGGSRADAELTEQGRGRLLTGRTAPVLLDGVGVMATASSGEVFTQGRSGEQRGLMAAPCTPPSTEHWFVGVGASANSRSELLLTNPDDTQAEVDLQFFGDRGEVVAPGSPGIVVAAHESRTVSLASLVTREGPLSVSVRASTGRVSAVARDLRSSGLDPAGADWHPGSSAPARRLVVGGVPEGDGERRLLLVNPGGSRATVQVQVLAQAGPFTPVGAESVELAPSSTTSVDLAEGLAGASGGIRLVSDQPVSAAVVSTSRRQGAAGDLAVQAATPALVRTGVVPLATVPGAGGVDGPESELVLSNGSEATTTVSFDVLSYEGVSLGTDQVLLGPGATSTRRLDSVADKAGDGSAYLVLRVPNRSDVHGAVVYSEPEGNVAGLATAPLTSPDVAGRAPDVVPDPSVGR